MSPAIEYNLSPPKGFRAVGAYAFMVVMVAIFLLAKRPESVSSNIAVVLVVLVVANVAILISQVGHTEFMTHPTFGFAIFRILTATFSLNLNFAFIYYVLGTKENFSESLTRVDAVYFGLTTFTTTGYGDIRPTSQIARAAVTTHLVLSLMFVLFVAGRLLSRLEVKQAPKPAGRRR
jgi:voltage-gated potassium channel